VLQCEGVAHRRVKTTDAFFLCGWFKQLLVEIADDWTSHWIERESQIGALQWRISKLKPKSYR
jgi:hypothetical protein